MLEGGSLFIIICTKGNCNLHQTHCQKVFFSLLYPTFSLQFSVCMQKILGELFNVKCERSSFYWTHTFQRVFVLSISCLTIIFPVATGNLICFWRDSYYRGNDEQEKEGHFQWHISIFLTDSQSPFDQAFTLIACISLSIIIYGEI